ncbi:non-heme iron oxygenase ferredoxin subunit [Pararhodobacter sp.]|uniref:non-heme iron oxygenase ferredoxin subunit n=1 Tax=Pararhodobacter sp. TaxID=2127056 RepID=UPI002AFFBEC8|nr:non-heme iron oxygenase ferredoxin subunit [Pararhodobacter sp.]
MSDWTELCAADALPEGEAKGFTIDGLRLCAVNDGTGIFVVADLCTHGQAYLSDGYFDAEECVLECPLHGGLFSYRDGSPQGDPAEKPVRSFPIRVEGGRVMVQL